MQRTFILIIVHLRGDNPIWSDLVDSSRACVLSPRFDWRAFASNPIGLSTPNKLPANSVLFINVLLWFVYLCFLMFHRFIFIVISLSRLLLCFAYSCLAIRYLLLPCHSLFVHVLFSIVHVMLFMCCLVMFVHRLSKSPMAYLRGWERLDF
jgi:hypothetical protein